MTISTPTRVAGPFFGTGSTGPFPFTFKVFAAADLLVQNVVVSTGVRSTLAITTDYTVTLNGNQNTNPGGSITLTSALAVGSNLIITSAVENVQPTDLTNQGGFYPEVITDALDRATIQIQQLGTTSSNAVHAPNVDGALDMELPAKDIRANKYLVFDANGLPNIALGTTNPAITSGGNITLTANNAGANVNRDFVFIDNTTEVARIAGATKRFGIGTSSPTQEIHANSASTSCNLLLTDSGTGSTATDGLQVAVSSASSIGQLWMFSNYGLRFGTNNVQRAVISSAGDVGINRSASATVKLGVQGASTLNTQFSFAAFDGATTPATLFAVRCDGALLTGVETGSPYNNTTATAANVVVSAAGLLQRSTSSIKYKTNVQDMQHGLSELMQLRPVTYQGKNDGNTVFGGLIAEEVHSVGLHEFVVYGTDGSPDALAYANMVSLAVKAIQELKNQVDALQARVASLEAEN